MVGILKGLKSDTSTENNTKAFSVLIAFSGGVWRTSAHIQAPSRIAEKPGYSVVRAAVVLPREAAPRSRPTWRRVHAHDRLQADLRGVPRVHEAQADLSVPDLLLSHVCHPRALEPFGHSRGLLTARAGAMC